MKNNKSNKTNSDTIINSEKVNIKMMVLTGMFTAMISIIAQIVIPTQPIPFSLSLFAIFLTGALLPPRYALLSTLAYILLGAFGVPVFAGFRGGFHVLAGMTGGYIAAYPLMGFITAFFYNVSTKNFKHKINLQRLKTFFLIIGMILSLIVCYIIGTLWFTIIAGTSFMNALSICVIPFIPFDLLKLLLAVTISSIIRKTALINP